MKPTHRIIVGDVRAVLGSLPERSVQLCMTSPPYWALRSYLPADHAAKAMEMGSEPTPEAYIAGQVEVFRAVRRVLRDDGVLVVNYGDCYAGSTAREHKWINEANGVRNVKTKDAHYDGERDTPGLKAKDLVGMPWRVALALQVDGWYLRSAMPWVKRSAMPESVTDRPASAVEYVFLLAKGPKYYWDVEAVKCVMKSTPEEYARAAASVRANHAYGEVNGSPLGKASFQSIPSGRNFRNADLWFQSVQGPHGLCGVDDELVGLDVTAEPNSESVETVRLVRVASDAAGDDTLRITSPSCPVHAGLPDRVPNAFRDARIVDQVIRSLGSDARLAQSRPADCAAIATHHASGSSQQSCGLPGQSCSQTANAHSTQIHKTDRALATNPPCISSCQSDTHTGCTGVEPACAGERPDTHASKFSEDGLSGAKDSCPSEQTTCRIADTDRCSCEHYTRKTETVSHFAAYPSRLVEPFVKAGTSEKGCCPACGKPWERVTKNTVSRFRTNDYNTGSGRRDRGTQFTGHSCETIGWQPACDCPPAEPVPCTVLDPFSGTGTTGVVACRHGRNYIGVELFEKYAAISERRIARSLRPQTYTSDHIGDATLFVAGTNP